MLNIDKIRIYGSQNQNVVPKSLKELSRDFENDPQLNSPNPLYRTGPNLVFIRNTPATFFNDQGIITTVNIDEPRFEYSTDGSMFRGLLVEAPKANFVEYSEDFTKWNVYTKNNNRSVQISTASSIKAPDGNYNTSLMSCRNVEGYRGMWWGDLDYPMPGLIEYASMYSRAVYIKRHTSRYISIGCSNVTDQAAITNIFDFENPGFNDGNLFSMFWEELNDGWFKIGFVRASTNQNTNKFFIGISNGPGPGNADTYFPDSSIAPNNQGVYIWGAQVEQSSFPTSYIPTNGARTIRAGDDVRSSRVDFSTFYSPSGYTCFAKGERKQVSLIDTQNTFMSFTNSYSSLSIDINGYYALLGTSPSFTILDPASPLPITTNALVVYNNTTSVNISTDNVLPDTVYTLAGRFEPSNYTLYQDGTNIGADTNSIDVSNYVDLFYLGSLNREKYLNGHILKFKYWPEAKDDTFLQTLTS